MEQTFSLISAPFNTTTLIKPMNEEEEEAPFGGPTCPPDRNVVYEEVLL
jgi:hypothetical protein